jgi:hypothetical protein
MADDFEDLGALQFRRRPITPFAWTMLLFGAFIAVMPALDSTVTQAARAACDALALVAIGFFAYRLNTTVSFHERGVRRRAPLSFAGIRYFDVGSVRHLTLPALAMGDGFAYELQPRNDAKRFRFRVRRPAERDPLLLSVLRLLELSEAVELKERLEAGGSVSLGPNARLQLDGVEVLGPSPGCRGGARFVPWSAVAGTSWDVGGVMLHADGEDEPFLRVLAFQDGLAARLELVRQLIERARPEEA